MWPYSLRSLYHKIASTSSYHPVFITLYLWFHLFAFLRNENDEEKTTRRSPRIHRCLFILIALHVQYALLSVFDGRFCCCCCCSVPNKSSWSKMIEDAMLSLPQRITTALIRFENENHNIKFKCGICFFFRMGVVSVWDVSAAIVSLIAVAQTSTYASPECTHEHRWW